MAFAYGRTAIGRSKGWVGSAQEPSSDRRHRHRLVVCRLGCWSELGKLVRHHKFDREVQPAHVNAAQSRVAVRQRYQAHSKQPCELRTVAKRAAERPVPMCAAVTAGNGIRDACGSDHAAIARMLVSSGCLGYGVRCAAVAGQPHLSSARCRSKRRPRR